MNFSWNVCYVWYAFSKNYFMALFNFSCPSRARDEDNERFCFFFVAYFLNIYIYVERTRTSTFTQAGGDNDRLVWLYEDHVREQENVELLSTKGEVFQGPPDRATSIKCTSLKRRGFVPRGPPSSNNPSGFVRGRRTSRFSRLRRPYIRRHTLNRHVVVLQIAIKRHW